MGTAGNQDLARAEGALIGDQLDAIVDNPRIQHLALEELHPAGPGGIHQFTKNLVRVEKVPGTRKKQPALDLLA